MNIIILFFFLLYNFSISSLNLSSIYGPNYIENNFRNFEDQKPMDPKELHLREKLEILLTLQLDPLTRAQLSEWARNPQAYLQLMGNQELPRLPHLVRPNRRSLPHVVRLNRLFNSSSSSSSSIPDYQ